MYFLMCLLLLFLAVVTTDLLNKDSRCGGLIEPRNHELEGTHKDHHVQLWFHIGPQREKPFSVPVGSAVPVVPRVTSGSLC